MGESVTSRFPCPWLRSEIELTAQREAHIGERHPDLLPAHRARLIEVIADPDLIRRSVRSATARLFSRWYSDIRQGRHIVVLVQGGGSSRRYRVVSAYTARWLTAGAIEWQRS